MCCIRLVLQILESNLVYKQPQILRVRLADCRMVKKVFECSFLPPLDVAFGYVGVYINRNGHGYKSDSLHLISSFAYSDEAGRDSDEVGQRQSEATLVMAMITEVPHFSQVVLAWWWQIPKSLQGTMRWRCEGGWVVREVFRLTFLVDPHNPAT